jgi:hypothetical protein
MQGLLFRSAILPLALACSPSLAESAPAAPDDPRAAPAAGDDAAPKPAVSIPPSDPIEIVRLATTRLRIAATRVDDADLIRELARLRSQDVAVQLKVDEDRLGRTRLDDLRRADVDVEPIEWPTGRFDGLIVVDDRRAWVANAWDASERKVRWLEVPETAVADALVRRAQKPAPVFRTIGRPPQPLLAVAAWDSKAEDDPAAWKVRPTTPARLAERRLADALRRARRDVCVQTGRLDSAPTAAALADAARRGVQVRIVVDDACFTQADEARRLREAPGVEVLLDPRESRILDDAVVVDRRTAYVFSTEIDSWELRRPDAECVVLEAPAAERLADEFEELYRKSRSRLANRWERMNR